MNATKYVAPLILKYSPMSISDVYFWLRLFMVTVSSCYRPVVPKYKFFKSNEIITSLLRRLCADPSPYNFTNGQDSLILQNCRNFWTNWMTHIPIAVYKNTPAVTVLQLIYAALRTFFFLRNFFKLWNKLKRKALL